MRGLIMIAAFVAAIAATELRAEPLRWDVNGHFYDLVTATGISWSDALAGAAGMTLNGSAGHLVTVTSAEENAFILGAFGGRAGAQLAWTGGYEPNDDGTWLWAAGSEMGTQFAQGKTATAPFNYANWGAFEPNDFGTNEDYMSYNIGDSFGGVAPGQWADSPLIPPSWSDPVVGYIVEFVPEPSTIALLGIGAVGLIAYAWRRREKGGRVK